MLLKEEKKNLNKTVYHFYESNRVVSSIVIVNNKFFSYSIEDFSKLLFFIYLLQIDCRMEVDEIYEDLHKDILKLI